MSRRRRKQKAEKVLAAGIGYVVAGRDFLNSTDGPVTIDNARFTSVSVTRGAAKTLRIEQILEPLHLSREDLKRMRWASDREVRP